ncbi:MAG: DNA repair protein RecN [Solirubrobacteraceae bacterium]
MLYELRVENLLLMERAQLRLGPGLNALTGETGAGKTLLAQALNLLLGGKARPGIVRDGAAEAYVEGVFELPPGLAGGRDERIAPDLQELVLARRVWPDGRTRAYVAGRSATLADLRELGARMLSFYGQHEHRKLTVAAAQLDVLDAFCGPRQSHLRAAMAQAYGRVRDLEERLAEVESLVAGRERELDLIGFELSEIEQLAPSVQEQEELRAQRERLRNQEALRNAALAGAEAITPEEGDGAAVLLARAAHALEAVTVADPALKPLAERLNTLRFDAEDTAAELRSYLAGLEVEPGQLEVIEERLEAWGRLERKYGGGIAEVLAHAQACRARCDALKDAELSGEALTRDLEAARAERDELGGQMSRVRAERAPLLAAAVGERLAELAMGEARVEVAVRRREGGYGRRGADEVEFLIAPNPGLPFGPLREIASGGELSRVMLALLSVAHDDQQASADGSLLVFDEIDAGIGGRTATAVGNHLRELAKGRQILCITHLPQIAAMAGTHFTIVKDGSETPARTSVHALAGEDVVVELVRMLGAAEDDAAARGHARRLLQSAAPGLTAAGAGRIGAVG